MSTVLVVDLQKGFMKDSFSDLPDKIMNFIHSVQPTKVIGTAYTNSDTSPCWNLLNWHGFTSPEETAFVSGIASLFDHVLYRDTYGLKETDSFETDEPVYIVGVDTDACVLNIAFSLFDAGIRPVVVKDLCASGGGKRLHEASLLVLSRNLGKSNIVDSASVPADWEVELELSRSSKE